MIKKHIPDCGDIYWINPNPVKGREMRGAHPFIVITQKSINKLGVAMTIPISSGATFAREMGLTVPILGHEVNGVAVCNQIRTFDLEHRVKENSAEYADTLDQDTIDQILSRVISIIDPEEAY